MNKTKTLNVRCTEHEYDEISNSASKRNMNLSMYMKECALNPIMPAFIPFKEKIVEECCRFSTEINLLKFKYPDISLIKLERVYIRLWQLLN